MTKTELTEIIREVVKAELRSVGPMLVREALLESLQGTTERPMAELGAPRQVAAARPAPQKIVEQRQKPVVKYSSNPILNAILNETEGGVPGQAENPLPPTSFDVIGSLPPEVLHENAELAAVATTLNMDFRSKMKAVDSAVKSRKGVLT
jgi:hypothetical protein